MILPETNNNRDADDFIPGELNSFDFDIIDDLVVKNNSSSDDSVSNDSEAKADFVSAEDCFGVEPISGREKYFDYLNFNK